MNTTRPRTAVGQALTLHYDAVAHCEALYAEHAGEVTDDVEQAEAHRDLTARQALEALAHHRRYLDHRRRELVIEREALDRIEADLDRRERWNSERIADLAEQVAPEQTRIVAGVRTIRLQRTAAVVTGEGFDPGALPPAWRREKPERVVVEPARTELDKTAAKADMLLGYREGEPPCSGWYDVEGHGRVWLECVAWNDAQVWTIGTHPPCPSATPLRDAGLSIEPEPGLDVLRWCPAAPGVSLERRTHVKVD